MAKINNKIIIITVIFYLLKFSILSGQDPIFTQFFSTPLYTNPGFAGTTESSRLTLAYRNQWPGLQSAYVTYGVFYDQPVEKLHGGIGIGLSNDRQGNGIFNRYQGDVIYAYHFNVTHLLSFSAGIQASIIQNSRNASNLIFQDMIDPNTGTIGPINENIHDQQKIFSDFSLGIVGAYDKVYFGTAVHHLHQPALTEMNTDENRLLRKYTINAGANIEIENHLIGKDNLIISPNIIYQRQQQFEQLNYGAYLIWNNFYTGLWVRQNTNFKFNSMNMHLGMMLTNVHFAYSYDFSLNSSRIFQNFSAHEVTFTLKFQYKVKRKKIQAIKCPKI